MTDLPTSGTISYTGAIETFTVATTGDYTIDAVGATGGSAGTTAGGAGASVDGVLDLTAGDTIEILVGGAGTQYGDGAGGGGGTFIYDETTNTVLEVAGGGGGAGTAAGDNSAGGSAQTGTSGAAGFDGGYGAGGAGGSDGSGGSANTTGYEGFGGAGGGGVLTAGGDNEATGGASLEDGGAGGLEGGGFGGGGGSDYYSGGGGGGASGGGGGGPGAGGGGGGSYSIDSSATITATNTSGNGYVTIEGESACYARGTRILTDRGEVAIEKLAISDRVVTLSGEAKPIVWLGHRGLDCRRHADPPKVWPIRVSAGAFAPNVPRRDLWLSPGHNIAFEGALVPVRALRNGQTVVQVERDTVEYWHVELERHDIIIADGLPAESYLESGNRSAFVEGEGAIEAHPDFEPKRFAQPCLPLVYEGPEVVRTKAALLERLGALGIATSNEADIHVMANGQRIDPLVLGPMRLAFVLPAGRADIALVSRTYVPAHALAKSTDGRTLGICVKRLQVDGEEIALDARTVESGWHAPERGRRWTRGRTPLPAGARLVLIDLAGRGHYWREPVDNVVALFG